MNYSNGFFRVDNSSTVLLPFADDAVGLAGRLAELVQSDESIFNYESNLVPQNGFRILCDGIEYVISVVVPPDNILEYRRIFCDAVLENAGSALAISLGENVAGGQRIAPIALGLMTFSGRLAGALDALAVAWTPSRLLSGKEYFIDTVGTYASGGAFPVLPTIDLLFSDVGVETSGLDWFSGQELCLTGEVVPRSDLTRRAVRIIHDIATNGALLSSQHVPDIDDDKHIYLNLSPDGQRVLAKITSKMEQLSA